MPQRESLTLGCPLGLSRWGKQGTFVSNVSTHCVPSKPLLYHSQNFLYYLPLFIILPHEHLISSLLYFIHFCSVCKFILVKKRGKEGGSSLTFRLCQLSFLFLIIMIMKQSQILQSIHH